MKLSEYKNVSQFLYMLTESFKKNKIRSSLDALSDYDAILKRILDSDYISYNCNTAAGNFNVDFTLKPKITEPEEYLFLFGTTRTDKVSHFMIELGEMELESNFTFSWYEKKLPPFLKDFIDEDGMLTIINEDEIVELINVKPEQFMSFDEFQVYLDKNKFQKELSWMEDDD